MITGTRTHPEYDDDDDQLGLFGETTKGMVRRSDPSTSHEAAEGVVMRDKSKLHKMILAAFAEFGPMTDMELEELPQFAHYAQTTVSKRRTELFQRGDVIMCNFERVNKHGSTMKVWMIRKYE
jgi:hypothetical protein